MMRRTAYFISFLSLVAVLAGVGGWPLYVSADEKPITQAELAPKVFDLVSDALAKYRSKIGKKPPCIRHALSLIEDFLNAPAHNGGMCPHCGLTTGSGATCGNCGESRFPGLTGVGTSQVALSYDASESKNPGHVSGVIDRKKSLNGEIEATVSIDIVYKGQCKSYSDEEVCAGFHATVEATIAYSEADNPERTISDIKVSNVSLDIKSLSCCKQKSHVHYHVKMTDEWLTPLVQFGEETLQTPQPNPSPSPVEASPKPGASTKSQSSAAPAASPLPINENPNFKAESPAPVPSPMPAASPGGQTGNTSSDYAPATTTLHGEVLVTANNQGQYQGATTEFVDVVDTNGDHHTFSALTDKNGHLKFWPFIAGLGAAIETIHVAHRLTNGAMSMGATTVVTERPPDMPGSQPVEGLPPSRCAITRASSVVDTHGTDTAVLQYQTTGSNADSRVLVNGSPNGVDTVAASDQSVIALARGLHKGLNTIAITANGVSSSPITQAIVSAHFVPLPPLHTGQTAQLTEYIDGVQGLTTMVLLTVSGAVTFADGTTSKWLPVKDGMVTQTIRAASHGGALDIKSELFARTSTFGLPPGSGGS